MIIASFDIGKKNFAFCIEEIDTEKLTDIQNLPLSRRYYPDGTCTDDFRSIIDTVCGNGTLILLENIDLTFGCDSSKYLDPRTFTNMTMVLDRYMDYWQKCQYFVIEQQMSFGNKRNVMALKLGQHVYSYFSIQFGSFKNIIEFPAYNKTKVLGAPKKMTKPQRKKWSVKEAVRILLDRKDNENITKINKSKKKDDLCDVITQLQAFKYITFVK